MKFELAFCFLVFCIVLNAIFADPTQLSLGQPTPFILQSQPDSYSYYQLNLPSPISKGINFILTPLSGGDSDLFMSVSNPQPQAGTSDFSSNSNNGVEYIFINSTDPKFNTTGPYYLSVWSHKNPVAYTLVAQLEDAPIQMTVGTPQFGTVGKDNYRYFKVDVIDAGYFIISSTDIYGDSDIYVSTATDKPTKTNYEWKHSFVGSDVLQINKPDLTPTTYYIGIYGSRESAFKLSVFSMLTTVQLSANMGLRSDLTSRSYQYFKFYVSYLIGMTIRLQRTSVFGDPNVYVSSTQEYPTSTNYTWKSERTSTDENLRIEASDANLRTGYLYLGVYDNSRFATTFQLTVALDNEHTILENSQAVSITTPAGKIDYFKYKYVEPAVASTVELAITMVSGNIQMFISKSSSKAFPSPSSYDFIGVDNGNGLVSYSIEAPVSGNWYYIGVQALNDQSANYTFVVSTSADSISLLPDRVYSFSISRNTYRFFVFDYEDLTRDVYFALRASSGDPDLYISITENPSASHFEWSSRSTASLDSQLITSDDPNLKKPEFQNKLYIGVHGYSAASFTLVAHISNTTLTLDNGVPVAGIVLRGKYNYYRYYMSQTGRLTFTLRHIGGTRSTNDADIYVSRKVIRPDATNHEYRGTNMGDDFVSVDGTIGWYYIGIYGYTTTSNYTLEVSADSGSLSADGYGFFDSVAQGTYRYYSTFIDTTDTTNEIVAAVTLVSGKTSLFALNNATKPTATLNIAQDTSFPGNVLKISTSMVPTLRGRYTFAVYGDLDSTYFIHVVSGSKPNYYQSFLKDGKPVIGTTTGLSYFSLTDSLETNKAYFVNLRLLGKPESTTSTLKLYLGTDINTFPTDTTNRMKKETVNDLFFKVPQYILSGASALISGIESTVTTYKYMLQIAKEGSPIYLTQYQPVEVITLVGETGYFEVYSPRNAKQLLIEMDSCTDGPAPIFYASATNTRPKEAPDRFTSQVNGKFTQSVSTTQQIRLDAAIYIETDTVAIAEKKYTVFTTTVNDQRPTLSDPKIIQVEQTDTTVKISFKKPSAITTKPTYLVYRRRIGSGEFREYINMETVCAIEATELQLAISDCTTDECTATVTVGRYEMAVFNIIVMDDFGNKRSYSPFYYNMQSDDALAIGIKSNGYVGESSSVHVTLSNFTGLASDQQTLVFSLLAYIGEVDLYISTVQYPTKENAQWKSENGGFDIITIKRNDPNYKATGPYYLTIYGEEQSKFGLIAYIDGEGAQPIILGNGDLIVATTARSQYTNYVYHLDNNEGLTATISPLEGDPDLYISTERAPTRYDHTWSSDLSSVEVVTIENDDPYYKAQSVYFMSVYGWREATYTIGVTKGNSNQRLAEGIPMQGIVKGNQYKYYMFEHIYDEDITISVTVLNALEEESDPDLYVSTTVTSPDSRQSDWRSTNAGGDVITISKDDPKFIRGVYYIGVRGYLRDSKYQIVVESENQNSMLLDGVPQQGNLIRGGKVHYFKYFYGYQEENLMFQANGLNSASAVGVYVSRVTSKPSSGKSDYPMQREGSTTFVRIEKGASIGWYYIGVEALTPIANYTLVVRSEQSAMVLQNGRTSTKNHVPSGYYRYFSFDISNIKDNKQHLVISINSEYGDPDLYVAYRYRKPSRTEYDFKVDTFGGDSISIELSQLPSNATTMFIAVYGFSSSRFSIVAYLSSTIVEVEEGEPISGRVEPNEYGHFKYTLLNPGRLRFNLKITGGSFPANAHLYVSTTNQFPNAANYDYASTNFGEDFINIDDAPPATYYISVHGQRSTTEFLLSVSTEFQFIDDNYSILDFQRKGGFRYFKAYVSSYASFVFASVTVINGLTALFVSTNETLPTEQYYDYSSHSWPGNALMKLNTDARFKPGIWTFGVHALEDSDFFMSFGTHEVALSPGQPKVGIVRSGKPVFFVYKVRSANPSDHLFSLKGYNPTKQVVAYISPISTRPDRNNNTYSIVSDLFMDNQGFLTLKAADVKSYQHFYIGVYGFDSADDTFEVTVSSEEDPMYITQEFHNLYQFKSTFNYYAMFAGKLAQHLQFFVYSCTADRMDNNQMVVYGSANQTIDTYPDQTSYQFRSASINPYALIVATSNIPSKSKIMFNIVSPNAKQLAAQQFHFSIYATTDLEDPRPYSTNPTIEAVYTHTIPAVSPAPSMDVFTVTIPGAITKREGVKQFTYQVVAVPYTEGVNAYTLCAIKTHVDVKFYEKITLPAGAQHATAKIMIEAGTEYMVNIIVSDDHDLDSLPYTPIRVKNTNVPATDLGFFSPLSVGFFLLLFGTIAIVLYFVIGIIVQLARKKRGVEVIPNLAFWKDLPFLIYDGIIFISLPCRRRGKAWNRLNEEYPEVDVENSVNEDPNPFKLSQARTKIGGTGGYGSIE